ENKPPSVPADTIPKRLAVPKSRTHQVLSTLSQSLSLSSLQANLGSRNPSRNVTNASYTSLTSSPTSSCFNDAQNLSLHSSQSSLFRVGSNKSEPEDPRLVSKAMGPAYWAGRFMALHDQSRNETLEPQNIGILIQAYTSRGMVDNGSRPNDPSSSNNPSTSVYAPSRIVPPSIHYSNNGIPHSSTSSAILQTACETRDSSMSPPPPLPKQPPPSYEQIKATAEQYKMRRKMLEKARALTDDDERCQRIFQYLEELCVTSQARRSLWLWQQDYARRTHREALLPRGGSMADRKGIVGRFFQGNRSSGRRDTLAASIDDHHVGGKCQGGRQHDQQRGEQEKEKKRTRKRFSLM
ncbi:hypothetical protein QBC46DRAFT_25898, partial [Diplogelasinospora grovesii]